MSILLTHAIVPALLAAVPAALPIQEGLVDTGGAIVYYKTVGQGDPLVIVHGGPGASHDYLLPNLYTLARRHQLVFMDERGSGRSPRLGDPALYTVENMAEDVEALRQALGLGRISLLGHSYGGVVAEAYALKYQQNLTHLVLGSTFASTKALNKALARMKEQMAPADRARLETLEKEGLFGKGRPWERGRYPEEYASLAWGPGYYPFLYGQRPDANYVPSAGNTTISWELYRQMWGSHGEFVVDGNLVSVEYLDRLGTIKVPTLIVVGDHDQSDPAMSKEMQSRIAGSQLVVLPNSGHMTFVDQPEAFTKAVEEFLGR